MSPFVMDVFSSPVLALRRLLLYPPSTRQTSNASGDDLERLDDRSSPNSVPPFHLVIPGHVQVQPHKYTDGHYLIVVPEATAPRSGR